MIKIIICAFVVICIVFRENSGPFTNLFQPVFINYKLYSINNEIRIKIGDKPFANFSWFFKLHFEKKNLKKKLFDKRFKSCDTLSFIIVDRKC